MMSEATKPTAAYTMKMVPLDAVLCYVDNQTAYFTTQALADQWGDDWNDSPYEHNSGAPYTFTEHDAVKGKTPYEIVELRFDVRLEQPHEWHRNSPYSVETINKGEVPWLRTGKFGIRLANGEAIEIWAGTTIAEFVQIITLAQGTVYWPIVAQEYQS